MTACESCLPVDLEASSPGQPPAVCASTLTAPSVLSPLTCPRQHADALGRALDTADLHGLTAPTDRVHLDRALDDVPPAPRLDEAVRLSRTGHPAPWVRLEDLLDSLEAAPATGLPCPTQESDDLARAVDRAQFHGIPLTPVEELKLDDGVRRVLLGHRQ